MLGYEQKWSLAFNFVNLSASGFWGQPQYLRELDWQTLRPCACFSQDLKYKVVSTHQTQWPPLIPSFASGELTVPSALHTMLTGIRTPWKLLEEGLKVNFASPHYLKTTY